MTRNDWVSSSRAPPPERSSGGRAAPVNVLRMGYRLDRDEVRRGVLSLASARGGRRSVCHGFHGFPSPRRARRKTKDTFETAVLANPEGLAAFIEFEIQEFAVENVLFYQV